MNLEKYMSKKLSSVKQQVKNIGIIDLGSNSIRLLIVHISADGAYNILNRVKHMVRLGENAFETGYLQKEAMQRTLIVLRSFKEMCNNYGIATIVAVSTAAMRDALNANEFRNIVRQEAGIELQTISGKEEARLICLGVSSELTSTHGLRIFMDIGGGSTEVALANSYSHVILESLKLGCVSISNHFLKEYPNQVPLEVFTNICNYVRSKASHTIKRLKKFESIELIGSSGTAIALQNIVQKLQAKKKGSNHLYIEDLYKISEYLCSLTYEERGRLLNVNSKRAEVLVAGMAILITLMEEFNFTQMTVSSRNLQDGILIDYLQRNYYQEYPISTMISTKNVRENSVLQLAKHCHFEEEHARHVAFLTLQIHDSAVDIGLINLDHDARELLYYAALLHDIGTFIAYAKHAVHGAYIIGNTDLLGFTSEEIDFIATLVHMHNLKLSKKIACPIPQNTGLRKNLEFYPLFLGLAENMDRLHSSHVQKSYFMREHQCLKLIIQTDKLNTVEIESVSQLEILLYMMLGEIVTIDHVNV